jgi:urease accessory protein
MPEYNLLRLLQLSDPTLPIGGFAHSSGLETYVQSGIVHDLHTAKDFVTAMLSQNLKYTDAAFASLSYQAAMKGNWDEIIQLDDMCTAIKLPKEVRTASQKLGTRLMKIFNPLCENRIASLYRDAIRSKTATGHYCIIYGMFAATLHIPLTDALKAFYYNAAVGMVTNAVKLVPLGQQDGQEMLFSLHELIETLASETISPDTKLLGRSCTAFDIRCMQHETLYSRLYMS